MSVEITFINLSDTDFHGTHVYDNKIDAQTFQKSPAQLMKARVGNESLIVKQETLSFLVGIDFTAICFWAPTTDGGASQDMDNGFGIRVDVPVQVVTIGPSPEWQTITYNSRAGGGMFGDLLKFRMKSMDGLEKSRPYDFPAFKGFSVHAEPTCSHSDISIKVTIRNAK